MIHLEATFCCVCPAVQCEGQLHAANWDTALAEVRLMRCRNGGHQKYIVRKLVLAEYDEKGYLTDLDLLTHESRKVA